MNAKATTVAALWANYSRAVGVPSETVQWTETERAFYAGAYATLVALRNETPNDEDKGVLWLTALHRECQEFARRQVAIDYALALAREAH